MHELTHFILVDNSPQTVLLLLPLHSHHCFHPTHVSFSIVAAALKASCAENWDQVLCDCKVTTKAKHCVGSTSYLPNQAFWFILLPASSLPSSLPTASPSETPSDLRRFNLPEICLFCLECLPHVWFFLTASLLPSSLPTGSPSNTPSHLRRFNLPEMCLSLPWMLASFLIHIWFFSSASSLPSRIPTLSPSHTPSHLRKYWPLYPPCCIIVLQQSCHVCWQLLRPILANYFCFLSSFFYQLQQFLHRFRLRPLRNCLPSR